VENQKRYAVDLWGSHPDEGNDDCWTGHDCDTMKEALAAFEDIESWCSFGDLSSTQWIILSERTGEVELTILRERRNPNYHRQVHGDEWRMEQAIQAGMAFGCDGYNDIMGW